MAGDLAERFHAGVMGIAAGQPLPVLYGDSYMSGRILEQERKEMEKRIKDAEAELRGSLQLRVGTVDLLLRSDRCLLCHIDAGASCASQREAGVSTLPRILVARYGQGPEPGDGRGWSSCAALSLLRGRSLGQVKSRSSKGPALRQMHEHVQVCARRIVTPLFGPHAQLAQP